MQFLRTLFWVVVTVIAAIFATKNWTTIQLNLWGGIVADVKLPVLLLIAFLAGLLPPLVLYFSARWRLRRRLDSAQRTIAELRPAPTPAPVILADAEPEPEPEPLASTASAPPAFPPPIEGKLL